jgi:hypothetical protein
MYYKGISIGWKIDKGRISVQRSYLGTRISHFSTIKKLLKVIKWEDRRDNSIFWHIGESEFETGSRYGSGCYTLWEQTIIPEWLPFR